jgi:hypothetical protein
LYRKLGRYHGLWNWGEPRPDEPWVIAYGQDWAEGHEKLVQLSTERSRSPKEAK